MSEATSEHLRRCLRGNRLLVFLDLAGVGLTPSSLGNLQAGLAENGTLRFLNLQQNGLGTWAGPLLFSLVSGSRIESLNLAHNFLGDQGLREFAEP